MASYRLEFTADGTPVLVEDDVMNANREPLGQIIAGDTDPRTQQPQAARRPSGDD